MHLIFNICETVADVSRTSQFHEFFNFIFGGFFLFSPTVGRAAAGPFWPFQPGGVVQCPILPRRKEDISQVSAFTTSHFNLPPRSSTSQPLDKRSFMLVKFKAMCLLDQIEFKMVLIKKGAELIDYVASM